jgi:hypothetical protein
MDQVGGRHASGVRFNASSNILPFCGSSNPVNPTWGNPSGTSHAQCPPPLAKANYVDHYLDRISFERALANTLQPDTNYSISVKTATNNPQERETLGVRLVTERLPLVGEGVETKRFAFNWNSERWEEVSSDKGQYYSIEVRGHDWQTSTLTFHTKNLLSDYELTDPVMKDWGELHSTDTGYYVELFRSTAAADPKYSVTLDEVSIVDLDMNELVHGYSPEDLETVMAYLQTAGGGNLSRSSSYYGTQGGHRATIAEPFGGLTGEVSYNYLTPRTHDASGDNSPETKSTVINITD